MVTCIKADFQNTFIDFMEQTFEFWFKVQETSCMGVNAHCQPVVFNAHFGDCCNAISVGHPFSIVHLLSLCRPSRSWRTARTNAVDQNQMFCIMRNKCFTCAARRVEDFVPFCSVMERTENYSSNNFQVIFKELLSKNFRLFRHIANRPQFDAFIPCASTLL